MSYTDSYEAMVGERRVRLSVGELQRLAMAQVLLTL
jgi:ABC-type transport system involved in Fe-S cluster assembly fused permease/ATPase subunit